MKCKRSCRVDFWLATGSQMQENCGENHNFGSFSCFSRAVAVENVEFLGTSQKSFCASPMDHKTLAIFFAFSSQLSKKIISLSNFLRFFAHFLSRESFCLSTTTTCCRSCYFFCLTTTFLASMRKKKLVYEKSWQVEYKQNEKKNKSLAREFKRRSHAKDLF